MKIKIKRYIHTYTYKYDLFDNKNTPFRGHR